MRIPLKYKSAMEEKGWVIWELGEPYWGGTNLYGVHITWV